MALDDGMTVAEAGRTSSSSWQWQRDAILYPSNSSSTVAAWQHLQDVISLSAPSAGDKDDFLWSLNSQETFTVSSCYRWFFAKLSGISLQHSIVKASVFMWKVIAPSKFLFFGWRIIHNIIATKEHLLKRAILDDSGSFCVFCSSEIESLKHLLGVCRVVKGIWVKVFEWLGVSENLSLDEFLNFPFAYEKMKNGVSRKIMGAIWIATCWSIWCKPNDIIFNKVKFSFHECMSDIVSRAWMWLQSSLIYP
ncbi:uncharacterized protein LOC131631923 [Vicia villosa]|uniref:uncharacterized protein LOC131631923 n=1 Tax=Vicia villosa TaxID=3911 RepID=UPI00273B2A9C|nr:uncharacterized protein LOC131631923 [Vicia villosa]